MEGEIDTLGPLRDGSRVAVIGGGPGGVASAITLKKKAQDSGINIDVFLYEGKRYEQEIHHNQCVGVLSPPINEILHKLDLTLPPPLIKKQISGYSLFTSNNSILIEGGDEPSIIVRRVLFDEFLLNCARKEGVRVINARFTDMELHPEKVVVYSDTDNREVDAIVGAFGLDDGTCSIFERRTKYRQPRFLKTIVTNIYLGKTKEQQQRSIEKKFDTTICVFFPKTPSIEFGAIVPKKDYLTLIVAGSTVSSKDMDYFIRLNGVRKFLPEGFKSKGYFSGKFPIALAKNFYGNRFVIVGDAAGLMRPFKGKGINTAILAGIRAAETVLEQGISTRNFKESYYRSDEIQEIVRDLWSGRLIRFLITYGSKYDFLNPFINEAKRNKVLERALYNSVSGRKPYRVIIAESFSIPLFLRLTQEIVKYKLFNRSSVTQ